MVRDDLRRRPGRAAEPRWIALFCYEAGLLVEPAVGCAGDPGPFTPAVFWRYDAPAASLPSGAGGPLPRARANANPDDAEHLRRVEECRRQIGVGELYQANLSRRLHLRFEEPPNGLQLCRSLQARERHSYAAWLQAGEEHELVSLTPECLLRGRLGERRVASYPIKGTAPPGAAGLDADPKERAEHVMIVDLVRNDLGRVARPGGVWVEPLLGYRDMRTLRHLESAVRADLREGEDVLDALCGLLPGGSITGAPKIAATRLIADLEGRPRGPYTGSLLAVDGAGNAVASLLIRTMILSGSEGWLDVGGGIVWGSDSERELEETRRKARAHLEGMVDEVP